ncbi:MAG: CHY zinc finger protein [Rhabdochlamydiaceae bacterium]
MHYHSPLDIIAIKFKCCGHYFACRSCHDALADHPAELFNSSEFQEQAILCGSCGAELPIATYLTCDAQCPHCEALFNPGCKEHWDLYFL